MTQNLTCVLKALVSFFEQFPDPSRIKDPGPPKSLVFFVWWTGLGSSQLYWVNYESSCAQNINPTIHTHSYVQNIYVL